MRPVIPRCYLGATVDERGDVSGTKGVEEVEQVIWPLEGYTCSRSGTVGHSQDHPISIYTFANKPRLTHPVPSYLTSPTLHASHSSIHTPLFEIRYAN